MQPLCELRLVETIPKPLNKKGIKSTHLSTFEAFMKLIKGSMKQFSMMSQWGFDGTGKGKYIFQEMFNGMLRKHTGLGVSSDMGCYLLLTA